MAPYSRGGEQVEEKEMVDERRVVDEKDKTNVEFMDRWS